MMSNRIRAQFVRPRQDNEAESDVSAPDDSSQTSPSDHEIDTDSESQTSNTRESDGAAEDLKDISFGALVEAQSKYPAATRKRKSATQQDSADGPIPDDEQNHAAKMQKIRHEDTNRSSRSRESRTSKHAPAMMSSKTPVSRRRTIFSPPPADKFRDPRFDAAVVEDSRRGNTSSTARASKNYSFLNEYQAAEVLELKARMKKMGSEEERAELKREIMSIEAKLRNATARQREEEIMTEHKRVERQAIREGKKARPYYLKQSDVKKQIEQERKDNMGKRARDKSEKRKQKREKTKEARDMPRRRIGAS